MTADATTSSDTRTVFRTCPLCEATCGLAITLEGDTVTHVRGDADDVFSRGFICPKGAAMKELHADPDRLRRPLVKRDGRHVEVSWPEAYAAVEAGLRPILGGGDPNAVAIYLGNPVIHTLAGPIYGRALIKALKTRNVFSASTVDQMAKHVSAGLMFGHPLSIPVPDIDRTDFLLIFGANPWVSNGSLWTAPDLPGRLKALQARGGRFVVVDPRRTAPAERAAEHVPIRPGTDAHMLCAMIRVLFEEGRADLGRLAAFTDGSDAVRAAVEPFTLDVVAETTGVPAETIRRLALALADGRGQRRRLRARRCAGGAVRDPLRLGGGRLERADRQPRRARRGDVRAGGAYAGADRARRAGLQDRAVAQPGPRPARGQRGAALRDAPRRDPHAG
jgi:anaerobic selenocysteine-containing dehydrogenase